MRINTKLMLAFLLIFLVPLVVISFCSYLNAKEALTQEIPNHLESAVTTQRNRVESIAQNLERLTLVSSRTQLHTSLGNYIKDNNSAAQEKVNQMLHDAQSSITSFEDIHVLNLDGKVVASTSEAMIGTKHGNEEFSIRELVENSATITVTARPGIVFTPGGGGGGPPAPTPSPLPPPPPPVTTDVSYLVSAEGVFTGSVTIYSADRRMRLLLDAGTLGLTEGGEPLSETSIILVEAPPPPPEDSYVIGKVYDFRPDGAIFDPPITLTFAYDQSLIPEGVAEENLVIAMCDEEVGQWVKLEVCVINPETNRITGQVSHFSSFTLLGYTYPATFTASNLLITPTEVDIGETVNIIILVINTGNQSGSCEVRLKINGVVEASQKVTLAAGGTKLVSFSTIKNTAGTYSLEVDGLTGSFAVKEGPVAPPPVPLLITQPPSNLPVIGGIIAAIAAAMGLIYFLLHKRRKYAAGTSTGSLVVKKKGSSTS